MAVFIISPIKYSQKNSIHLKMVNAGLVALLQGFGWPAFTFTKEKKGLRR